MRIKNQSKISDAPGLIKPVNLIELAVRSSLAIQEVLSIIAKI